jgi:hypothetical protein
MVFDKILLIIVLKVFTKKFKIDQNIIWSVWCGYILCVTPIIIYQGWYLTPTLTPPLTSIKRVRKGIFVSRKWSIFVRVKCEMLDFSVVKCDLFYSRGGQGAEDKVPGAED